MSSISIISSINSIITTVIALIALLKLLVNTDEEKKIEPYYIKKIRWLIKEFIYFFVIIFTISFVKYIDLKKSYYSVCFIIIISILFLLTIGILIYMSRYDKIKRKFILFKNLKKKNKIILITFSILFLLISIVLILLLNNFIISTTIDYREHGFIVYSYKDFFIKKMTVDENIVGNINLIRISMLFFYVYIFLLYRITVISLLLSVYKYIFPKNEYLYVKIKDGEKYYNAKFITMNKNVLIFNPENSMEEVIVFTSEISQMRFSKNKYKFQDTEIIL